MTTRETNRTRYRAIQLGLSIQRENELAAARLENRILRQLLKKTGPPATGFSFAPVGKHKYQYE